MNDLAYASLHQLIHALRQGEVSALELADFFLGRIEKLNRRVNAVVAYDPDAVRRQARDADRRMRGAGRPLHGIPFTVKDSFETAQLVSTAGTLGRRKHRPKRDAVVVERLRRAGGILLGKTNTSELCLALEVENLVYGRTSNPYDVDRTSGGSSGGAAAAVALGLSAFDVGTDVGGSVRVPANFCGVAAIKPTPFRVPGVGNVPPSGGANYALWGIGPLTRSVDDLRILLPLIGGPDRRDPMLPPVPSTFDEVQAVRGLRVAVQVEMPCAKLQASVKRVLTRAASALEDAGAHVDECMATRRLERSLDILVDLIRADAGAGVKKVLALSGTGRAHPWTQGGIEFLAESGMSVSEYFEAFERWDAFRIDMHRWLAKYDVLLSPVTSFPAPRHGEGVEADRFCGYLYSMAHNVSGWSCVVVRCGADRHGLPIGVQVVTRPWCESLGLSVAKHLETALGGFVPPRLA